MHICPQGETLQICETQGIYFRQVLIILRFFNFHNPNNIIEIFQDKNCKNILLDNWR